MILLSVLTPITVAVILVAVVKKLYDMTKENTNELERKR